MFYLCFKRSVQKQKLGMVLVTTYGFRNRNYAFQHTCCHHKSYGSIFYRVNHKKYRKIIKSMKNILRNRNLRTKKVVDNGVETVTTYENGVLKSHTVNGVAQALEGGGGGGGVSPRHRHALQHGHRRRHH